MNGYLFTCCNKWHPSPASHRTGPRGECVIAALQKPMRERPAQSPVPAQTSGYWR